MLILEGNKKEEKHSSVLLNWHMEFSSGLRKAGITYRISLAITIRESEEVTCQLMNAFL